MKIFITGGAGFIGHHLTERLLQQGHSVVAIDNFSTGSKQNIQSFQAHPNYSFHMGNAEDATFMDPFIKESDVTFHMAATVGVMNVVKNSIQTIENNIIATGQILAATAKYEKFMANHSRFLFVKMTTSS